MVIYICKAEGSSSEGHGGGMVLCVHVARIMGKVRQEALILFLIGLSM